MVHRLAAVAAAVDHEPVAVSEAELRRELRGDHDEVPHEGFVGRLEVGEFQDVVISELKEHTYFATIRVSKDGEIVEIGARPSDAIAVAVTCEPNLPIYVAEEVLESVLG